MAITIPPAVPLPTPANIGAAKRFYNSGDSRYTPSPDYCEVAHNAPCDSGDVWQAGGDGELGWDTTHFYAGTVSPPQSVKVTGTGTIGLRYIPASPIDLTNKYLRIRLRQNHTLAPAPDGTYTVKFYSEADYSKYSTPFNIWYSSIGRNQCDDCVGWHEWTIPMSAVSLGTLDDLSAITKIYTYVNHEADCEADFGIERLQALSPLWGGHAVIRIDAKSSGAYENTSEMAAYATAKGVPLTLGVAFVQNDFTEAQIQLLREMGHEVVIYGGVPGGADWPFGTTWPDWTAKQKLNMLAQRRYQFDRMGFNWNGVLFVPGGGGFCVWDRENLLRPGLVALISGNTFSSSSVRTLQIPGSRYLPWTGFIDQPDDGDIPTWLAAQIAEAETNGGTLVLGAHVSTANCRSQLKASIDALEASSLRLRTFGQLINGEW